MPRREDLLYAVPLCQRRYIVRTGQHGTHHTCYTPMRWDHANQLWYCARCNKHTPPSDVLARASAVKVQHEAA